MNENGHCVFCEIKSILLEEASFFAIWDKHPVSKGHILLIPRRHASDFFDLNEAEFYDLHLLIKKAKEFLDENFSPSSYNIGTNCGKDAGQTIMHCHIHLIPRYVGDVLNPTGGVRAVIPDKQDYLKGTE